MMPYGYPPQPQQTQAPFQVRQPTPYDYPYQYLGGYEARPVTRAEVEAEVEDAIKKYMTEKREEDWTDMDRMNMFERGFEDYTNMDRSLDLPKREEGRKISEYAELSMDRWVRKRK